MTARTPPRQVIIDSATRWCELVTRFPRPTSRGLVLHWSEVPRHVDAATITARAVVSLDGVEHAFHGAIVAPTCWDTRTTVWLRWILEPETPVGILV